MKTFWYLQEHMQLIVFHLSILCKAIHIQRNDTCPTVILRNCACVKQVLIGWKLIFGYKAQWQQIHHTVERFSTNQNPGYRMSPSVRLVENRSLWHVSSKEWCGWTLYLQNPTPVLFEVSLSKESKTMHWTICMGRGLIHLASSLPQWKGRIYWGNMFFRGILTAMIYRRRVLHLWLVTVFQAELFLGNQIYMYMVVLSITLNSFTSLFLSLPSTVW